VVAVFSVLVVQARARGPAEAREAAGAPEGAGAPPLSGKVDLHALYCNAGFVLDDDRRSVLSAVRVRVVQHSWAPAPTSGGVERRSGSGTVGGARRGVHGDVDAPPRLRAERGRAEAPEGAVAAVQEAMECRWAPPWERESWKETT